MSNKSNKTFTGKLETKLNYHYFPSSLGMSLQLREIISLEDNFQKAFGPHGINHQFSLTHTKYKLYICVCIGSDVYTCIGSDIQVQFGKCEIKIFKHFFTF